MGQAQLQQVKTRNKKNKVPENMHWNLGTERVLRREEDLAELHLGMGKILSISSI
jgi:hypothetical protein